jgi:hypothetical protein
LEVLEELVVLTRLVRSSAISRMALAGILLIPDELDNPDEEEGPDGGQSEAMNPLAVDMINTGAKAIDDPANASAWMPFIVQGPAEYLQHLRHIPFEASSNEQVMQRTEAIMRLARGLDVPVEIGVTFTLGQPRPGRVEEKEEEMMAIVGDIKMGRAPNHWNDDGDLVITEKTLFRLAGYRGFTGAFYPPGTIVSRADEPGGFSPLYQQIATWVEGEGWKD